MGDKAKDPGLESSDRDDRFKKSREAYQDFLSRQEEGEDISTDEFLRRHPEMEEELKILFNKIKDKVATDRDQFEEGEKGEEEKIKERLGILGDFRIIREIGKGGMATVYEAEQVSLKRKVALKVLPSHLSFSDEAVRKFLREAEAGGRQNHGGIVSIYAVGQHEGLHYIAEELVAEGYTLANRLDELREEEELPVGYFREAAKLIAEVSEALQHAHESKVIHRDVKPSNILLTPRGQPKVTDFGLARIEDALTLSRTGDFAGTPYYMSPEQAMSRRIGIDRRTDVYSLGVTLYETLVLKPPFEGKTSHEVLKKIILHEPKDPRKLNPRVPRDLAVICHKSMEKEPNRRYQTMEEFGEDLNRFLNGEVIKAKPARWPQKGWKWAKRNPLVSVGSGVVLVFVLCFLLLEIWSVSEIWKERKKAEVINDFLLTVLMSPNPDVDGKDVTMLEAVDKAVKEVESYFVDQPELETSMRDIFGEIYEDLGRYKEAEEQYRRELKIYQEKLGLGPDDEDTLRVQNNVACALLQQDKYSEAEMLFKEILEPMRRELGSEDEYTLACMDNLATAIYEQGRLDEAEIIFREVLIIREKAQREGDTGILTTRNNLAGILFRLGRFEEASALFQKVLVDRRRELGPKKTATLRTMMNVSSCYLKLKDYGRAEKVLKEVLETQLEKLDEEHPDTVLTMKKLGYSYYQQGKYDEADALQQKVMDLRMRKFGKDNPKSLESINSLALTKMKNNEFDKAQLLLDGVKVLWGRKKNYYCPARFNWMESRALLHCLQGEFDKASSLFNEVIGIKKSNYNESHEEILKSRTFFARAFRESGRFSEVEDVLKEGDKIARKAVPREDPHRISFHLEYGEILRKCKKDFKEAEVQWREAYEGLKILVGDNHEDTRAVLEKLMKLCEDWSQPDKVEEYATMLDAVKEGEGD